MADTIKVTLTKSGIGCPERHKRTLVALGLKKLGGTVELARNDTVLGMIDAVKHLVAVESN